MAMDAAPMLKRKGTEAPEPWLLDGVPIPATKIRRLDAEVPLAEPGAGVPPPPPFGVEEVRMSGDVAPAAAAAGVAPVANEERAIVVYQPAEAARNLLHGPLRPGVHLRVNPDWIHGLKGTMLQEASNHRALFEELASRDENPNLAMVPWAPAQAATTSTAPVTETMDADQDGDGASMEVEQDGGSELAPTGVALQGDAFHHHQQQQWPPQQMELPAASYQPSPVTWSW